VTPSLDAVTADQRPRRPQAAASAGGAYAVGYV
jgi:hypothetical protein